MFKLIAGYYSIQHNNLPLSMIVQQLHLAGVKVLINWQNAVEPDHFDRGNFAKAPTAHWEGLIIEQKMLEETHPNFMSLSKTFGENHCKKNDSPWASVWPLEAAPQPEEASAGCGSSSVKGASTLNAL